MENNIWPLLFKVVCVDLGLNVLIYLLLKMVSVIALRMGMLSRLHQDCNRKLMGKQISPGVQQNSGTQMNHSPSHSSTELQY